MGAKTITVTDRNDLQPGDLVTVRVTDVGPGTDNGDMDYEFVSATREVPEYAPGTTGTATVRGIEGVPVMRTDNEPFPWASAFPLQGDWLHASSEVTDFVPDEPRELPTRQQVVDALFSGRALPSTEDRISMVDAVEALLRGESR